ncbi:AzlC family ABC transporter permease [Streptomyces albiaxialis]|uniref:AzlC family ABC transporter permease n=1 Tax=Streptomyces albiaxialis TaxID=329523 RepID=A0ABN2W296_9ACTN
MRSFWRTLGCGPLRDIGLVCLAVGLTSVSYGAIAVASGFPVWFPALLGLLVLAGSAEFMFTGILAAGGGVLAALLASLLVNARHLPYGLAIPEVTRDGLSGWRRLVATHVMNDESVLFALAQHDLARKRAAYWACGLGVLVVWPLGAFCGSLLGAVIPDPDALGLDAMFPAALLALVLPALRVRGPRRAALAGTALALCLTPFLPVGLPVLLALAGLVLLRGTPGPEPREAS